jgi:hypothetical protein
MNPAIRTSQVIMYPSQLLRRLNDIGSSLEQSAHALALIGLGSVGLELEWLDEFSDLDFFAIVEPGYKQVYMDDLGWLSCLCPVIYAFRNTVDGYKLLFADGIFCEFAVFEPQELPSIPFTPGRIVWQRADAPAGLDQPVLPMPAASQHDTDWLLGEALTNLMVGLGRERRGEKLTAMRFIQGYAVDRLLELAPELESAAPAFPDAFDRQRRFEQRYPKLASLLPSFMQGYERNRESATAILDFLQGHFGVNLELVAKIRELAK